ncbi:hypothetical protein RKE30_35015 [Streptomyces sp. Li-HN-5-11]|uniref:hypothetical protein n=1 Tax=Streptomyces sp. Li-HN-5-11 TaxID=3075432 RepID=UPI0028B02B40|nr:hypothetical protein [Streptomyces sp. Li-HN-5-11]WNM35210.1 hypothetical protein RKE30_35015 [Streptomyces sp. Li-HN-5-11]
MRALPARRIASSALCAALLVGITAPTVMAADSARERGHAASHEARLPGADVLLAQIGNLNAFRGELAPVADLLTAALKADHGQLPAAEARRLGDAAKGALAKVAAKAPAVSVRPPAVAPPAAAAPAPATGVLLPAPARDAAGSVTSGHRAADPTDDALEALQKALDSVLQSITSGDVSQVLPTVTGLLTGVINLITGSLAATALPAPADSASASASATAPATLLPAVTLPAITLPTTVTLPAS